MDITKLPFNQFIGLQKSIKSGYLLMLDNRPEYRNHLDTVHASALFALAEATSGYLLLYEFSELTDNIVAVVRKVDIKYSKPASGVIFSKAAFYEIGPSEILMTLNKKGRATLKIGVSLYTETKVHVMQAIFEWFVIKKV